MAGVNKVILVGNLGSYAGGSGLADFGAFCVTPQ